LAASGSREPAAASVKQAGRRQRASPRPGTPSCCRR
jgi:hypothetical protein